jgi:putative sporulation protein YyaC
MTFSFKLPSKKDSSPLKVSYTESDAVSILASQLYNLLSTALPQQEIVIVCVGTDRSTGDALGPLVGTQLSKKPSRNFSLFGTLEEPVHAMNLQETMQSIQDRFQDPFIIAVDACLGQITSVGCIQVGNGPVKPGAGVNKDLPPVGNIHITGIVNVGGFMEYFVLQNTRLSLVMKMSELISDCIETTVSQYQQRPVETKPFLSLD